MSLAALTSTLPIDTDAPGKETTTGMTVTVAERFDEVRAPWLQLQAEGQATPYQQIGYLERFFDEVEAREGARAALALVRDGTGAPLLLLPLSVTSSGPVRIARFIGGPHCNFNMPVCSTQAARLSACEMHELLQAIGRAGGIDLFALTSQPAAWQGFANPLALIDSQPSPSAGCKLTLQADSDALFRGLLSKDARRKLRQKEARLAGLGPLAYERAKDDATANAILDRYFSLRASRFAEQGIDNPFAGAEIQRFFRRAATEGIETGAAVMDLHALMLRDQPIAIFGTVTHGGRMSGVITAFGGDAEAAKYSPGEVLLNRMIAEACARGLATFDLGVGEARYKDHICPEPEPVSDSFVPVTFAGRAAGVMLAAAMRAKRALKQSDLGKDLIARVRALKARS